MAKTSFENDSELLEITRQEIKKPSKYKVLMLNDDYTTMEFVVDILKKVFGHSTLAATSIMLNIHKHGRGLAGIYTKEIAEAKVSQVHSAARSRGFPLKCEMEKE
ncbi:MAG: ATP-dependent Clp protease adapter ClpS [Candidatus Riflebacteria bacterium]|nr:ATP-dependent Clp protease adapter ClpS [Candidatus Riflebacteria bacterium]MBR4571060.1 ATP-dependent Clp protease adapter ClpS [Candidatus Riflebacteria bacterium]